MAQLKEEAEALAACLRLEAANASDIVAWADRWIASLSTPHWSVCELSVASNKSEDDLVVLLHAVPGPWSPESVQALTCAWLRALRKANRVDDRRLARSLCHLGIHAHRGKAAVQWSGCFHDDMALADEGILVSVRGYSRDDLLRKMNEVLDDLCASARWTVHDE